jgi:hypothetical protein
MDKDNPNIFDMLVLNGAIELAGVDPVSGEFLYAMTEKMIDIMPEVYEEHLNEVNKQIMLLWEEGFITIDLFDENPLVNITAKALDKEELAKLDPESLGYLNEIKRVLAK